MGEKLFSVANGALAACFTAFAVLQFNDPDPMYWVLFYALGAMACLLFHLKRLPPSAAGAYAILCGVLAALWIILGVLGQPLPGHVPGMAFEEEKEVSGFVIVGAWMAVLYVRAKRAGMK